MTFSSVHNVKKVLHMLIKGTALCEVKSAAGINSFGEFSFAFSAMLANYVIADALQLKSNKAAHFLLETFFFMVIHLFSYVWAERVICRKCHSSSTVRFIRYKLRLPSDVKNATST